MGWGQVYYRFCQNPLGHRSVRTLLHIYRRLGWCRGFRMPLDALDLDHRLVARLMKLWSRIHWNSGDGMMPPEELLAVYRLAATWPVDGDIVELGAWVGLTTSYLAAASEVYGRGIVHAVDTFEGTKEGGSPYPSIARFGGTTLGTFRDQVKQAGVADQVRMHVGFTSDVACTYPGRPIRVLLIDADHSYDGVRRDFRDWLPHVAPGGLILFHDYLMPDIAEFVASEVGADLRVTIAPGQVLPNLYAVVRRPTAAAPLLADARQRAIVDLALPAMEALTP